MIETRRAWIPIAAAALAAACGTTHPAAVEVRVATYNVESVGPAGSEQYRALVDVLRRVGADVVLVQEIDARAGDLARVEALAGDAGYEHRCVSEVSGTLSGSLHTACLSRFPIVGCRSRSAAELSGDPRANDITRDVLEARVRVDPEGPAWGFLAVHLKGGREDASRFRRQVEVARIVQAVRGLRKRDPDAPVVLAGDFNDDAGDSGGRPARFESPPAGLPPSFRLGGDVAMPVVYGPFEAVASEGLEAVDARHEDDPRDDSTRIYSRRRLDYLWVDDHLEVLGTEVYDSCDDNGRDDPPPGNFLRKAGTPLRCKRTGEASDHFPVFADLVRAKRPLR